MVVHDSGLRDAAFSAQTRAAGAQGISGDGVRQIPGQQSPQRADTDQISRLREEDQKEAERKEAEDRRLEAIKRREEAVENVVARSEDGDTLQVDRKDADINNEEIGEVVARGGRGQVQYPPEEDIEAPEVRGQAASPVPAEEDTAAPDVNAQAVNQAAYLREGAPGSVSSSEEEASEEETQEAAESDTQLSDRNVAEQTVLREEARKEAEERAEERQEAIEEEQARREEASEEVRAEQQAAQTSSNFVGISDSRLEQMYLDGEISRNDYQKEVDAREAEREQLLDEENQFSGEMSGLNRLEQRVDNQAREIDLATSDEANDNLTAQQRLDILQNLQENNVEETKREEEARVIWQAQFLE